MWSMKLRAVAGSCPPLEQADEPPAREILIDGQAMLRVARDGAADPHESRDQRARRPGAPRSTASDQNGPQGPPISLHHMS
jgi:hypothetical protein